MIESKTSLASFGSAIVLAGLEELSILDKLPKGALITIVLFLFSFTFYFAKRDYKRINDSLVDLKKENGELRKEIKQEFEATREAINDTSDRVLVLETKEEMRTKPRIKVPAPTHKELVEVEVVTIQDEDE